MLLYYGSVDHSWRLSHTSFDSAHNIFWLLIIILRLPLITEIKVITVPPLLWDYFEIKENNNITYFIICYLFKCIKKYNVLRCVAFRLKSYQTDADLPVNGLIVDRCTWLWTGLVKNKTHIVVRFTVTF